MIKPWLKTSSPRANTDMLKQLVLGLACAATLVCARGAEEYFSNPALAGDYPDPSVIRVGKDYWAVATSSEWSPQFPILHSVDLVNWEVVGSVFSHRPMWATGNFWAPEITRHNDSFYIYYVARRKNGPLSVAVAVATKPQGPYNDLGPLVSQPAGSIDPVTFKDENGNWYLIWKEDGNSRRQPCVIWAQRLADNGVTLLGEPKELIRNEASWEGAVVEGPFIVRRGQYFYMFYSGNGCCGLKCNYALGVARAPSLLGPWEKNPANPILTGNNEWKCPGHGSIVDDPSGRHWLMYHAYNADSSVFTGREAMLDEVKFTSSGWPEINMGTGPSHSTLSPFGLPQFHAEQKFRDDFNTSKLSPGWNWPVSDDPPAHTANGELVLRAPPEQGTNFMGGVVGRSITSGDFIATTVLRRSTVEAGVITGLAALGDRANSTGIALQDDRVILWNRSRGQTQILAEAEAPKARILHFRLTSERGEKYQFAFSPDGRDWTDLSPQASGEHLPPWDRAVRVGMIVGGVPIAEVRYESFEIQPR